MKGTDGMVIGMASGKGGSAQLVLRNSTRHIM